MSSPLTWQGATGIYGQDIRLVIDGTGFDGTALAVSGLSTQAPASPLLVEMLSGRTVEQLMDLGPGRSLRQVPQIGTLQMRLKDEDARDELRALVPAQTADVYLGERLPEKIALVDPGAGGLWTLHRRNAYALDMVTHLDPDPSKPAARYVPPKARLDDGTVVTVVVGSSPAADEAALTATGGRQIEVGSNLTTGFLTVWYAALIRASVSWGQESPERGALDVVLTIQETLG